MVDRKTRIESIINDINSLLQSEQELLEEYRNQVDRQLEVIESLREVDRLMRTGVLLGAAHGGKVKTDLGDPTPAPDHEDIDKGFNVQKVTWSESGQMANPDENMALYGSFYANRTTGGTIDPATGWPVSGNCQFNMHFHNGIKVASGTYEFVHSGSGNISPATRSITSSSGNLSWNTTGQILNPILRRVGGGVSGKFSSSFVTRLAKYSFARWMNPRDTNGLVGDYRTEYPNVLLKDNPAAPNVFYHRIPSWSDIREAHDASGTACWICIHIDMTDQDITDMLTEFVGAEFKLILEYGNENWNSKFRAYGEIRDNRIAAYNQVQIDAGQQVTETQNVQKYVADRIDEIGEEAKTLLGAENVEIVYASQAATPNFANSVKSAFRYPHQYIDRYVVAAYCGQQWAGNASRTVAEVQAMGNSGVVAQVASDFESRIKGYLSTWKTAADEENKLFGLYEMGPSLDVPNTHPQQSQLDALFVQAVQSAEMGAWGENTFFPWLSENVGGIQAYYRLVGNDVFGARLGEIATLSPIGQAWENF